LQAQSAGKSLAKVRFDLIFSSDLDRAFSTCKNIMDANEVSGVKDIKKDKRVRERHFGELENRPFIEYLDKAKEGNINTFDYTPEGGETLEVVRKRAKDFFLVIIDYVERNVHFLPNVKHWMFLKNFRMWSNKPQNWTEFLIQVY
jgi:broad specificity phosphatase PhoE